MDAAGALPTTTSMPQLEMQPLVPGAEVPGAPVADSDLVQKSWLMPHWPNLFWRRGELVFKFSSIPSFQARRSRTR